MRFLIMLLAIASPLPAAAYLPADPPTSGNYADVGPMDGEIHCLALNIYFEARSEPLDGQIAVGYVTLNRTRDPRFPPTICQVVAQGGNSPARGCQFSWRCDRGSDEPTDMIAWIRAESLARRLLEGITPPDPSGGAVYYHVKGRNPSWATGRTPVAEVGRHVYYK